MQGSVNLEASSSGGGESATSQAQGTAANDTAAALVASLLTSVLEAPVELFRHRMQARLTHYHAPIIIC